MLEGLLASLLNRVLGAYVANLETKQLDVGIWKGDVTLQNLQIRRDALDKLGLPLDVTWGHIGQLTVQIPWKDLKNQPLHIELRNVLVLAAPRSETAFDAAQQAQRDLASKLLKLEMAETMAQRLKEQAAAGAAPTAEEAQKASFTTLLLAKVLDNLQVSVAQIHVRYEDSVSSPIPFAIGVTLGELSAVSGTLPPELNAERGDIHKVLRLQQLAVYWRVGGERLSGLSPDELGKRLAALIQRDAAAKGTGEVLEPVSGAGTLTLFQRFEANRPKTRLALNFDQFAFALDDAQYQTLLAVLETFTLYVRNVRYRALRPPVGIRPKDDARAWLQYAVAAVRKDVRERTEVWSWAFLRKRRDLRLEYVALYQRQLQQERLAPAETARLDQLTSELSLRDLRFYRTLAQQRYRTARRSAGATAEAPANAAAPGLAANMTGWVSSWWRGGDSSRSTGSAQVPLEQMQMLYEAIAFDPAGALQALDVPPDAVLFAVDFVLKRGSFRVRQLSSDRASHANLLTLAYSDSRVQFSKLPKGVKVDLTLGATTLEDGTTPGTLYPQLIRAKDHHVTEHAPLLDLTYMQAPPDALADHRLEMRMRPLQIVWNERTVEVLQRFLSPPAHAETMRTLLAVAEDSLETIKTQTRAGLALVIQEHKVLDVRLEIEAPVLVVPQAVTQKDALAVIVDAGKLTVASELVPRAVKSALEQQAGKATTEELHRLLYDQFQCSLTAAQLLVGDADDCLAVLNGGAAHGNVHVIDPVSVQFDLGVCIIPPANKPLRELPTVRLAGELPRLSVALSDRKWRAFSFALDQVLGPFRRSEQNAAPRTSFSKKADRLPARETATQKTMRRVLQGHWDDAVRPEDATGELSEAIETGEEEDCDSPSGQSSDESESFVDAVERIDREIPGIINRGADLEHVVVDFRFTVAQVSAALSRTEAQGVETSLADLSAEQMNLQVTVRPYGVRVEFDVGGVGIVDRLANVPESDSELKYLVTSQSVILGPSAARSRRASLAHVIYVNNFRDGPSYTGVDADLEVRFSELDVLLNRESILAIYDWIVTTFAPPVTPVVSGSVGSLAPVVTSNLNSPTEPTEVAKPAEPEEPVNAPLSVNVRFYLSSLTILVHRNFRRYAVGQLADGHVTVHAGGKDGAVMVAGELGRLCVLNVFDSAPDEPPRDLLQLQGEQQLRFRFLGSPTDESSFQIKVPSLHVWFHETLLQELAEFFGEFARMHALLEAARRAAAAGAATLQETSGARVRLDVVVETPIIEFASQRTAGDCMVAYLGELRIRSSLLDGDALAVSRLSVALTRIRLVSRLRKWDGTQFLADAERQELPVLQDASVELEGLQGTPGAGVPALSLRGHASPVSMTVTEQQYAFLREFLDRLGSSGADAVATVGQGVGATVETAGVAAGVDAALTAGDQVDVHLDWPCVSLDLQRQAPNEGPLARLRIQGVSVRIAAGGSRGVRVEVGVQAVGLDDTRRDYAGFYRELLPLAPVSDDASSERPPQLLVSFAQQPSPALRVDLDSPRVLLMVDQAFEMLRFLVQPRFYSGDLVTVALEPPALKTAEALLDGSVNGPPVVALQLNVTNVEVALLADPQNESTEAIVLAAKRFRFVQEKVRTLDVRQAGAFVCAYDERATTQLRVISSFDLMVDLADTTAVVDQVLRVTEATMTPLIVRVSCHDVLLVLSIVEDVRKRLAEALASGGTGDEAAGAAPQPDDLRFLASGAGEARVAAVEPTDTCTVASCEKAVLRIPSVRLMLIDDLDDLPVPMVDATVEQLVVMAEDWSTALSLHAGLALRANAFNQRNAAWEPLVEPWECTLNMESTARTAPQIDFFSRRRLEINVTDAFVQGVVATAMRLQQRLAAAPQVQRHSMRETRLQAPFLVKNATGHELHVWAEGSDVAPQLIAADQEVPWRFDDWVAMREATEPRAHRLVVQLDGSWETLKGVAVDREGVHVHVLRPTLDGVAHRLVCEVRLVSKVRVVTLRSGTVVRNETKLPLDVRLFNQSVEWTVAPGHDRALPIVGAFRDRVQVRPDGAFAYGWCNYDNSLFWRDLAGGRAPVVECRSPDITMPAFRLQVWPEFATARGVSAAGAYPLLTLHVVPPLQLENLLPYDIRYIVFDKTARHEYRDMLRQGDADPLHTVNPLNTLGLSIDVLGTSFRPSEATIISNEDQDFRDSTLVILDAESRPLELQIAYVDTPRHGGRRVIVYSPYVLLNRTPLPLMFRQKALLAGSRLAAGQQLGHGMTIPRRVASGKVPLKALPTAGASKAAEAAAATAAAAAADTVDEQQHRAPPLMFSYTNLEPVEGRAQVRLPESSWSTPITLEAIGSQFEVAIPTARPGVSVFLGARIDEGTGPFFRTRVVTFAPRVLVGNALGQTIHVCQAGTAAGSVAVPARNDGQRVARMPMLHLAEGPRKELRFRLDHVESEWSAPINVEDIGRVFVKLARLASSERDLVCVDVTTDGATLFVTVGEAPNGRWPFVIENGTDAHVTVFQTGYTEARFRQDVAPHSRQPYAWDFPSDRHKTLTLVANGRSRSVNIAEIGPVYPLRYPTSQGGTALMALHVVVDGRTLCLRLSDYDSARSLYRVAHGDTESVAASEGTTPAASRRSSISAATTAATAATADFEVVKVSPETPRLVVQLRLEGIGISVVDARQRELLYATLKDVDVTFRDTIAYQTVGVRVRWIQVDNQLFGAAEPIVLYPTVLPREEQLGAETLPVLHAALVRSKDQSYGVEYYKYFSCLLQELSIALDEDILYALMSFSVPIGAAITTGAPAPLEDAARPLLVDTVPSALEPPEQRGAARPLYFEVFQMQPIKLNVSFSRTEQTGRPQEAQAGRSRSVIQIMLDVFTMTVGSVHDAPLRLTSLVMEHPFVTAPDLLDLVLSHYAQQAVGQLHKVLGSADILGNPVGLFNTISSGVGDMFYEPLQGFVSDRPQDLGIGLAKGTASFMKKTVYGFSDTFSKFTGSVGKGMAVATLDRDFQEQRRIARTRNRPKHAMYGVSAGISSLARSMGSAISGVVVQPLAGAERDGVGGFFKGVGKGLIGAVTKPMVGVLDLASNVTEGIKNTTTVFERDLDPVRLPRFVDAADGILRPYNAREALGLSWARALDGGKYAYDGYVAHLELRAGDQVAILFASRLVLARIRRLKSQWELPYDAIHHVKLVGAFNELGPGEPPPPTALHGPVTVSDTGAVMVPQQDADAADPVELHVYTAVDSAGSLRFERLSFPDASSAFWFKGKLERAISSYMEDRRPLE